MGSVEKFDPKPATNFWMKEKQRKPHNNSKNREQEWFNGVFEESKSRKNHSRTIHL